MFLSDNQHVLVVELRQKSGRGWRMDNRIWWHLQKLMSIEKAIFSSCNADTVYTSDKYTAIFSGGSRNFKTGGRGVAIEGGSEGLP
jgi:hypothetical protein